MASLEEEEAGGSSSQVHTARSHDTQQEAERRAAEEEELFTSWNTNTVVGILSDVRRFESQVFQNIEKQLDFLRRRQGKLYLNVEELNNHFSRLNDNMEMVNSIVDRNSVYRSRRASMGGSISVGTNKQQSVDFTAAAAAAVSAVSGGPPMSTIDEVQPSADVSGIQTELQELRSDFDELRNQFHNNHVLDNRFKALEEWITVQFKDQTRRIDGLYELMDASKATQQQILDRLETLDQENQQRNENMRQDLENKIQALEYAQMSIAKDMEVKMHGLHDTLSIHDLRSKGIESKIARVTTNVDDLREQHDTLQTRYFDQIYASINELYAEKASKADLAIKADLALALSKADQSDIDKLQGIADELQRRLIALLAETSDKVNAMDAKLDRRSDRIVTYCLKELKKEFRHLKGSGGGGGGGGDGDDGLPEGTNIGKVRCLVCDHVSTQHRDQDVVQTQHDKLTHTLKTLRPRSPSPNGSPEKTRPGTATGGGNGGGGGGGGTLRPLASEDPGYDDQGDFRFRATAATTGGGPGATTTTGGGGGGGGGTQKLPTINATLRASVPNLAQSAPLIQIISHHLPVDVKMHQAQQLQQQQQQQQLTWKGNKAPFRGGGGDTTGGGATMFSHTANAVVVKAAELYPTQFHDTPSPHHGGSGGGGGGGSGNNGAVTSSNAALSRPKSAPPKRA